MAVTLTLYQYNKEAIRINKYANLTKIIELSGFFREPTDVMNPSIIIEYSGFPAVNYAYIQDLNRYYFIRNITVEREDLYRLDMHVDVLYSFAGSKNGLQSTGIYGLSAYVDRYVSADVLLIDNIYPMLANATKNRYTGTKYSMTPSWVGTSKFLDSTLLTYNYMVLFNGTVVNSANNIEPSRFVLGHVVGSFSNLLTLMGKLNEQTTLSGNKAADYLYSVKFYPVPFTVGSSLSASKLNVPGFGADLNIPAGTLLYQSNNDLFQEYTWKITVTAPSSVYKFRNFKPYTNIALTFMPFGRFELDNSIVFASGAASVDVYVKVSYNIINGDALLYYSMSSTNIDIYLGAANIAIDCPLSSSSYSVAKIVNSATSLIGSAAGFATGDPVSAALGTASGVVAAASAFDASSASMTAGDARIIDDAPAIDVYNHPISDTAYSLYGRPYGMVDLIGMLTGYCKIGKVHVEDLTITALEAEKEEIEALLLNGVIA